MGCRNDYMQTTDAEKYLSRVASLIDELDGKPVPKSNWDCHPQVYGKLVDGDALVERLCTRLQGIDVTKQSLELQLWWRDHQAADVVRVEQELLIARNREEREAAIAKLTPYERHLLGIVS